MVQSLRARVSTLAFGLCLAVIYAVAVTIVSRLGHLDDPDLMAGALTLDLTLLVPVLYYFLMVRPRRWPVITVVPVFLVSVLIAGKLIPESRQHVLDVVRYAVGVAEIVLIGFIAHKTWQLRRGYRERAAAGSGVYESLRESARSVLGPVGGGALAYEIAVLYYAVAGWRRSPEPDPRSFTIYRTVGYTAFLIAMMGVVVVETVAVHLLVRQWTPVTAWILTALSIYAAIWLIGDYHALRWRPVCLSGDTLHLRMGLRWTIPIPIDSIREVEATPQDPPSGKPDYLKAVLIGAPNRRIVLAEPVRAEGIYGFTRQVRTIDIRIDDPARFDAALDEARAV